MVIPKHMYVYVIIYSYMYKYVNFSINLTVTIIFGRLTVTVPQAMDYLRCLLKKRK